ncbi:MAG: hypothetical protein ACLU70_02585 [Lachnospira sp.]
MTEIYEDTPRRLLPWTPLASAIGQGINHQLQLSESGTHMLATIYNLGYVLVI